MTYNGSCLCENIAFNINTEIHTLYHCHCSLCRKQSGTGGNAATLIQLASFQWLKGKAEIRSFQKPSGFRSDFCAHCGSPVPNIVHKTDWMWIPLGLLNETPDIKNRLHFCMNSKVAWLMTAQANHSYETLPETEKLFMHFK